MTYSAPELAEKEGIAQCEMEELERHTWYVSSSLKGLISMVTACKPHPNKSQS
jgi:hypothetical protein